MKIGDKSVETIQDIRRIYEQLIRDKQREKRVMLEVLRGGLRKWIMLDYRDEYE